MSPQVDNTWGQVWGGAWSFNDTDGEKLEREEGSLLCIKSL